MDAPAPGPISTAPSSTSSSSWWPLSTKGWLLVGGAALGCLALFLLRKRSRRTPRIPGEYDEIMRSLRSDDLHQQTVALKQLYEYSRYPKKHDSLRESGVLEILLQILSQHPDNDVLLLHLARVVANLAINSANRLVLGRASTVSDLFYLLGHTDDRIKEHILRCLLNLSLEESIEDVIRETNGLSQLIELFTSSSTSPSVLFQTTRVLINLVHNARNKELMLREGLAHKTVQMLPASATMAHLDFCLRLVNLLGLFAVDCTPEVLAQIATKETAEGFSKLLALSQSVEHVSTILQATLKILEHKRTQPQLLLPFLDAFAEQKGAHPSGIESVVAIFTNSDGAVVDYARHVLFDLAQFHDKSTHIINSIDPSLLPSSSLAVDNGPVE